MHEDPSGLMVRSGTPQAQFVSSFAELDPWGAEVYRSDPYISDPQFGGGRGESGPVFPGFGDLSMGSRGCMLDGVYTLCDFLDRNRDALARLMIEGGKTKVFNLNGGALGVFAVWIEDAGEKLQKPQTPTDADISADDVIVTNTDSDGLGHWELISTASELMNLGPQDPRNPLNPKQQERMKETNYRIPLNYFNILEATKTRVRKRLQDPNCRALIGIADVDDILENKTTISPFDQQGVISNKEGVAAETVVQDDQGNRVLNGQINFSPLYGNPFFFSGFTARGFGISGRKMSQNDLRDLVLIHELVHTGDATGKYDDMVGIINSRLNRLIVRNCF